MFSLKRNIRTAALLITGAMLAWSCGSEESAGTENGGGTADPAKLYVVSFNIRVDNPSDGVHSWENRRDAAVAMVQQERPTVMGLQEAQPHQITWLTHHCPEYAWYGIGRDTGEVPPATESYASEESAAIFWLTSEVELLDKGTFWLSESPATPSKGWDAAYNRTCTWGLFRHKASGKRFYYYNTHLDHSGKTAREESIKLIANMIVGRNEEGLPVVLSADFNSNTSNAIFAPLFDIMRDARAMALESDDHFTFNNYGSSTTTLDHIFYSGCIASQFRTLTGDYGAPYISDHYPIKALLILP